MKTKNIRLIIGAFLAGIGLMACTDYEGSKLEVMDESNVTLTKATASISGCSLSGDITDVVDCYITLTGFDGSSTTVKLTDTAFESEEYLSTNTSGQFVTKISLKISDNYNTLKNANQLKTSYNYSFKPGKLTGVCYIHKATGVDSTYTFTCANAEKSDEVLGDSIDGKPGPVTEANLKAWMKTIYNSGVCASFIYMLNEKGWPVCYTKKDDEVVYDFE